MPSHHGKQKQLAKRKKKRELAQHRPRSGPLEGLPSQDTIVREAALLPQGPAFLSAGWRSADEDMPELVTAVVTRIAPAGFLIPSVALVDRTCLGIKNGFVARPSRRPELDAWLRRIGAAHGGIEQADLLTVQSIVYHALDYARSLGFAPHADFPEPLFGPRPALLLDTPLARPARPTYVPGPDDDSSRILAQLERAAGKGSFGLEAGSPLLVGAVTAEMQREEEEQDEEEDDEEEP